MRTMARHGRVVLAAVALASAAALAGPRGGSAQGYTAGGMEPRAPSTAAPAAPRVSDRADSTAPLPAAQSRRLRNTLRAAVAAVPGAAAPYRIDRAYSEEHVYAAGGARRPGVATAERYYEVPDGTPKSALPLGNEGLVGPVEVTVAVNAPILLPDLTSLAADTTRFVLPGAEAAQVVSIPPRVMEGRVAAMRPEEARYRLGAIFLVVGDPALEAAMRNVATGADRDALAQVPVRPGRHAGEARWITVRVHGPLAVVERMAKGVNTRALRKLLSP